MKILVAEDDSVSLLILRRSVERAGNECLVAEDGEEAWRLYEENPEIDTIISDWMMPGIDGLELCRRVRGHEQDQEQEGGYTYFIFLTALEEREYLLQGFEAGADDYLSKPLDHDELSLRLISAQRLTELYRRLDSQRSELERLNQKLSQQARTDPLTGIGNRLRMREDLEVLNARSERYGGTYGLVLLDVDHFKLYNDSYGHIAGDRVLQMVSEALTESLRRGDTIYRYGGEEFLALLPEQTIESCELVAERLRESVEQLEIPHEAKNPPGVITTSCGVCALSEAARRDSGTPDRLLKEADDSLYIAKERGRNLTVACEL